MSDLYIMDDTDTLESRIDTVKNELDNIVSENKNDVV